MWLITPVGFFSIVQKPSDRAADTLTVRARVRGDLEALRDQFLPGLGRIEESKNNDYRFRAVASRSEVAAAMASLINQLDYQNFKGQVAKVQGPARANLYHHVWDVLYRLQADSKKYHVEPPVPSSRTAVLATQDVVPPAQPAPSGPVLHPRLDHAGQTVTLQQPSQSSSQQAWIDPEALACVVPDGSMPAAVNGIPISSWTQPPQSMAQWEALVAKTTVAEPEFKVPAGYKKAAGVVIQEADGRIWVVAPSNAFGGYKATFPKGKLDKGLSLQATALVEAFEKSGLQVRLIRHLVDVKRSTSYTRYYLAERIGGNPADMGWESQGVMLVPAAKLKQVLNSPNDQPIVAALTQA